MSARRRRPAATGLGAAIGRKLRAYALRYQWRWIVDDRPFKVWEKSRRIGATYAEALRAVIKRLEGRRDYWFSSADETAAEEFIEYCRFWAEFIGAAARIVDDAPVVDPQGFTRYRIRFANGRRITSLSSSPRNFRSKGGDVGWDEAAWHDRPREMWAALSMAATWGGQVSVLSTHNGEGSLFAELVKEAAAVAGGTADPSREAVIDWSYHRTTIEDAVEDGLVEKILGLKRPDPAARAEWLRRQRARARDEDTWNQECMCVPSAESATLLTYDLIGAASAPADELLGRFHRDDLGRPLPLYGGLDVGRERDLSIFAVGEAAGDLLSTRHFESMERTRYSDQLAAVEGFWARRPLRRFCGDATGIGDMLIESVQDRHGRHRAEKVKFTAEAKEDLATGLLGAFQDRRILVPDLRPVREGLHKVRKTITAAGNVRYDAARDAAGHADEFWAIALMWHAFHAARRRRLLVGSRRSKPRGW